MQVHDVAGGGGSSRPARALVGRERECARLDECLRAARRQPAALAISGEPGIGKTRLLEELAVRADAAGALVLEGRAAEFEQDVPFAVLDAAMTDYLSSLNPRRLERLPGDALGELARIFPPLAELARAEPESGLQDERHRSYAAVRVLLERLAVDRPLVLALDDLHWADEASLELLSALLRRRPRAPVLLAVAFRPAQAPPRLHAALADALRDELIEAIEPDALKQEEAALLLEGFDEDARSAVYRETGGNPFYLEQIARASPQRYRPATVKLPEASIEGVPPGVTAAIETEVNALTGPARALLDGAAVIGESFGVDIAAAAADLAEEDLLPAADELLDRVLIAPTDTPRRFRFRHPIVRRAVYEAIGPGWRLSAHCRVAAAMRATGASTLELARHVEAAAKPGDSEAVDELIAAAARAAPRAPAAAAHWHGAVLRLLPDDDPRRLEQLIAMATALGSAGRLSESRDTLGVALAELGPEQESLRLAVVPFISLIEHLLGNHAAARGLLDRALADLPAEATRDGVVIRLELAADRFYMNEDTLADCALEALASAREVGEPLLVAEALGLAALGAYRLGDVETANARYQEADQLLGEIDDMAAAERLVAICWLGWYGQSGELHEEGVRHMDRALAISRMTGQGHLLVPIIVGKAICLTALGRLAAAAALADEAVEMGRLALNDQSLAWALTLRCWIAATMGDTKLALACGEESVEVVERIGESLFARLAGCYLGEALVEAGEPERARDAILLATNPELEPIEPVFRPHFYEVLARAEIATGDLEAARDWAARAQCDAALASLPGRTGEALRARAAVELAGGELERAEASAAEAADSFAEVDQRVDAARARLLQGRALASRGSSEQAVAALEDARRELSGAGAARWADAAAMELRRLGRRVARTGSQGGGDGIESLSGREREVAMLVADGKTNRAIAAELYVSEKTVESHMSRIFRKLGVERRAQVAAAVGGAADQPPKATI